MTSQVFYRKWRPQVLAEVVGQEHVTRTLLNALANERISHAYLFCGPRGTGKTSTARGLAKAVNCLTDGKGEPCNTCDMCTAITEGRAMDVIEVDAASNTGVDDIRSLREKVNYAPNQARYKVYIIDEVHMLSTSASNALLKTLEEPPPHVIFILATTETHKLLPTILSRCQRFDFHRLSQNDVINKLAHICESEGITIEPEALRFIARAATGSLRDAENLLQQLTTYHGSEIGLAQARALLGISDDWRARELLKNIVDNDIAAGITTINSVNSDGLDLRQFNRELIGYLRALLLIKTGSKETLDLPDEDISELKELAGRSSLDRILKAVKQFGELDLKIDNYSTLPLEMALVDCAMPVSEETRPPAHRAEPAPAAAKTTPARQPSPQPEKPVTSESTAASISVPPAPAEKVAETPQPTAPVSAPPASGPPVEEKPEPEAPVSTSAASGQPVTEKPQPAKITPATAAKKETVQPATAIEESPLAAGSDIEQLRQNWSRIINDAPDGMGRTPTAALLRSAKLLSLKDDTVMVSFKFSYHKEKMDSIDNQKIADKIVSSFLGRPCRVCCVYEHENNHLVKAALGMGAQIINTEEA